MNTRTLEQRLDYLRGLSRSAAAQVSFAAEFRVAVSLANRQQTEEAIERGERDARKLGLTPAATGSDPEGLQHQRTQDLHDRSKKIVDAEKRPEALRLVSESGGAKFGPNLAEEYIVAAESPVPGKGTAPTDKQTSGTDVTEEVRSGQHTADSVSLSAQPVPDPCCRFLDEQLRPRFVTRYQWERDRDGKPRRVPVYLREQDVRERAPLAPVVVNAPELQRLHAALVEKCIAERVAASRSVKPQESRHAN